MNSTETQTKTKAFAATKSSYWGATAFALANFFAFRILLTVLPDFAVMAIVFCLLTAYALIFLGLKDSKPSGWIMATLGSATITTIDYATVLHAKHSSDEALWNWIAGGLSALLLVWGVSYLLIKRHQAKTI